MVDSRFWKDKKVFLTGHTGFKGGWLSLWLEKMGAEVLGFSLEPTSSPNLFTEAKIGKKVSSVIGDIRNKDLLHKSMSDFQPEIILHMAAQPLVRQSYIDPVATYETNVIGTVNLLESARLTDGVKTIVNITTDKCYENNEWVWGYRENEKLGGYDPYSSSKACSELVTSAYRRSFFTDSDTFLATARAGNVIGGGDWSTDRLIPDILRSFSVGEKVKIRNPKAVRPWQHVLEPLSGYLILAQKLFNQGDKYEGAWNFGPHDLDAKPVEWIVKKISNDWGSECIWEIDSGNHPHEANYLKLDISNAESKLLWSPKWSLEESISNIISWHKNWLNNKDASELCLEQIDQFIQKN